MNALMGGNKQSNNGSGSGNLVGQLAGSLLGGGKQSYGSSGHGSSSGGSGNLVGQLAGSLLGGGKQHGSSSGTQNSSSGQGSSGGLGSLLGGVLGGGQVRVVGVIYMHLDLYLTKPATQAKQRLRLQPQLCIERNLHRHRTAHIVQPGRPIGRLQQRTPQPVQLLIASSRPVVRSGSRTRRLWTATASDTAPA